MTKKIFWASLAVAVCAAPCAHAQGLGGANAWQGRGGLPPANGRNPAMPGVPPVIPSVPPAMPGNRDDENRRDEPRSHFSPHLMIPHIGHTPTPSGGVTTNPAKDLQMPNVAPSHVPSRQSEFKSPAPPRFTPPAPEGGTTRFRNLPRWGGSGIVAGVAGAIAAVFGSLFRRKKDS